jgi:predicted SAM-dependent methyltransferase
VSLKLNLGCGVKLKDDFVNVDLSSPVADVTWDLDVTPWPFEDDSARMIIAEDLFEHLHNPIAFMVECHRVLKRNGDLLLRVPYYRSETAYTDPTHVRFCTEHTWDYWVPGTALFIQNPMYGNVQFRKLRVELVGHNLMVNLRKA